MEGGDNTGSYVLDQLEYTVEFVRETEEKGVTIIQMGGDNRVDQGCGAVGSERRADVVDLSEVEVGGADGVVDVGLEQ